MKSVIRSAKPYWIYLILTGKKTVEVGKDSPKANDWNRTVEMYCSKDMRSFNRIPREDREWMQKYLGKVACRFVCSKIKEFDPCYETNSGLTCLTEQETIDYAKGKTLYGWHISDLKIYDTPKELSEFNGFKKCAACKVSGYEVSACIHDENCMIPVPLTRPFQSWGYVEELGE